MNNLNSLSITPRDTRSFVDFLSEARRYPLLDREQEIDLCLRARAGDTEARNQLTCSNMLFVVRVAKEYIYYDLPFEDLVSAGLMGLLAAAEAFDPSVGVRFISYAVHTIRTYITRALSEYSRTVRMPLNVINRMAKIRKIADRFIVDNGRYPSDSELAALCSMSPDDLPAGNLIETRALSISAPLNADSDTAFEETMASSEATDAGLMHESLQMDLERSLQKLGERDAAILRELFGLGCEQVSIDEVARRHHLSRERVRQIERDSLAYLRHFCKNILYKYTA